MDIRLTVGGLPKSDSQIDGNKLLGEGEKSRKGKHDDAHPTCAEHRGGDYKQ
jgi:hypothetical protein